MVISQKKNTIGALCIQKELTSKRIIGSDKQGLINLKVAVCTTNAATFTREQFKKCKTEIRPLGKIKVIKTYILERLIFKKRI